MKTAINNFTIVTPTPLLRATLHYRPPSIKSDFHSTTEATEARNIFRIDQARLAANISHPLSQFSGNIFCGAWRGGAGPSVKARLISL